MDIGPVTGGSISYPTGKEVTVTMTGAQALTVGTHGNKILRLSSNSIRNHLTFPDATTMTSGKRGFGVVVSRNSAPIPVFNGGTLGTDPVFEGWLRPGAAGQFFTTDIASAKGHWQYTGDGLVKAPINFGGVEADMSGSFDIGGTAEYGTQGNDASLAKVIMLTGTLGVAVYNGNDTNDDIFALPFKINLSGGAVSNITWAAAQTTVFSHATDVYYYAGGIRLSATKMVVRAYNVTQSRMEYKAMTITDASTPSVASSGSTVTDATATHAIVGTEQYTTNYFTHFVKDGGDDDATLAFWVRGPRATGGTNTQVVHYYTVSGDTITRAAEYNDTGITETTNLGTGSYSPTATVLYSLHRIVSNAVGQVFAIKKLTYSAGSITLAWTCTVAAKGTATVEHCLWYVDPTNGVAWGTSNVTGSNSGRYVWRITFNTSTGAHKAFDQRAIQIQGGNPSSSAHQPLPTNMTVMPDANSLPELVAPYYTTFLPIEQHFGWYELRSAANAEGVTSMLTAPPINPHTTVFDQGPYNYGYHRTTRLLLSLKASPDASGGNQKLRIKALQLPRSLSR